MSGTKSAACPSSAARLAEAEEISAGPMAPKTTARTSRTINERNR
jgi:hypothetical protein